VYIIHIFIILGKIFLVLNGLLSGIKLIKENKMVEKMLFGPPDKCGNITLYSIGNKSGVKVTVCNYGARVTSVLAPDNKGNIENIALGYDSPEGYLADNYFIGAIVGRYGNRIKNGRFKLEGKEFQLNLNNNGNHLHGGFTGFDKVFWKAAIEPPENDGAVTFTYESADGEENYPGNVILAVTYSLSEENELTISYSARTSKTTILNPTHHSYFNLSGNLMQPITDHLLTIEADFYTPVYDDSIPTGEIAPVENTPLDFRKPVEIGAGIESPFRQIQFAGGYDHNWVLNNYNRQVRKAAEAVHPLSGRKLEVFTDMPGIQFYSGNFLETTEGLAAPLFAKRTGFCLEAQYYPDSPNKQNFPSPVIKPGDIYRQTTIYKFSVIR